MTTRLRRRRLGGFTLIEVMVALAAMALMAVLSWRGLDGMIRVQHATRDRMDGVVSLQTGLTQWSTDLDAVFETGQVSAVDYDGRVLRLTRRDTSVADSPLRVIGWSRRAIPGVHGGLGSWVRWQSPPLRNRAELQDAWSRVELWGQNPSDEEKQREVAVAGLDEWQVFYYRNDAWTNPQSTASSSGNTPSTSGSGVVAVSAAVAATGSGSSGISPVPDGVRVVLTLSAGQPLTGVVSKDWVRPVIGGGKS